MKTLKDLFKFIYTNRFLSTYANLEPASGINHRMLEIAPNKNAKPKPMTDEDKAAIKNAWTEFVKDGSKVIDEL